MIIDNCAQLSDEWFQARSGIPSASNFNKIVTSKGATSKSAEKYMMLLAGERILGTKEETYQNAAMERGILLEPEARALYEMTNDVEVQTVGLCYKDEKKEMSCSPDGLIGENEGIEIKCPSLAVHVGYLLKGVLPTDYVQQVQGSMYITGRKYWVFMSYYPGIHPLIIKIERDIEFQTKLGAALNIFNKELDSIHKRLIATK